MMHPLDQALQHSISGNPDTAEAILKSMDQNDARVQFNLGWHAMRHGRLREGLDMMDAGRFINCFGSPRIPGAIWRDEPLEWTTVLFRCEGGYGDQILNFRFAKDFQDKGARVVVACSKELIGLFSAQGFKCIADTEISSQVYDYWIPAMSAAHMLGYDHGSIAGAPYLHSIPLHLPGSLRIGLRWAGLPQFEHEQHRRFDPQLMLNLSTVPRGTFYALQRDDNVIEELPFTDLRANLDTWENTASIISGLDLVITSCTSIAHLSGALGVPTWVIVPVLPYYCWSFPGDRSVWYDSVRLFRQEKYGDWSAPFQKVREALEDIEGLPPSALLTTSLHAGTKGTWGHST